jgi:diguanylate cyclase
VARFRPHRPRPWQLFAIGQFLFVAGDAIFNVYELALHQESPFPSIADGLYLFGYLPLVAALLILMGVRSPGQERSALIDACIVGVALGMPAWIFLMGPYAHDTTLSAPQRLISIAYPFMDVLLIGVAVRLFLTGGRRTTSFNLIILAIVALLAADVVYTVMTLADTYHSGAVVDAGWLASYVLWGAAGLHPSMRKLFEQVPFRTPTVKMRRIIMLSAASLMPPAVMVVQHFRGEPLDPPVVAAGSAILVLLVIAHLAALVNRMGASGLDSLTGLPTQEPLAQALHAAAKAAQQGRPSVLLYLDLHRFAVVNDTLGRHAGDQALAAVARLIAANVRHEDFVARTGGDEFAILSGGLDSREALDLAERLRAVIGELRFGEGDRIVDLALSIGVALVDRGVRGEDVLSQATLACDRARARGRDKIEVFDRAETRRTHRSEDGRWGVRLKDALREDRFVLLFQPIVEIATGRINHHEALLRLRDEDGRLISAGEFVPAAERLGLVGEIDRWVIRAAAERVAEERRRGNQIACAINLSGLSVQDDDILGGVKRTLAQCGVQAESISFEITETAAMTNLAQAAEFIERLREMGCEVALDDFGSGFSSFTYLRSLNVDVIKIDGAFIRDLARDPLSQAMVLSINQVAHSIGTRTVGEAVEDGRIFQELARLGTDLAQGHHLGPPTIDPLHSPTYQQQQPTLFRA